MERYEGVTGTVVRKEKEQMISISTGDIMHVMGSFGLHMDYTVRMKLRLTDVIDVLFPGRTKPLTNSYIINARPMIGAALTHHNCVQTVTFEYSDRVKAMPFDWQCTVHRGDDIHSGYAGESRRDADVPGQCP